MTLLHTQLKATREGTRSLDEDVFSYNYNAGSYRFVYPAGFYTFFLTIGDYNKETKTLLLCTVFAHFNLGGS